MLHENGGTIDDLLVYKMGENEFFLVINAANIDKDYAWITSQQEGFDVKVENQSEYYGQLAVQGPEAEAVVEKYLVLFPGMPWITSSLILMHALAGKPP